MHRCRTRRTGRREAHAEDAVSAAAHGAECTGPVDTTAAVPVDVFGRCVQEVAADDGVDAVLAVVVPTALSDPGRGIRLYEGKPVLAVAIDQADTVLVHHGVPSYATPEGAARAGAGVVLRTLAATSCRKRPRTRRRQSGRGAPDHRAISGRVPGRVGFLHHQRWSCSALIGCRSPSGGGPPVRLRPSRRRWSWQASCPQGRCRRRRAQDGRGRGQPRPVNRRRGASKSSGDGRTLR